MPNEREIRIANSVIDVLSRAEKSTRTARASVYGSLALVASLDVVRNIVPEGVNYPQAGLSAFFALSFARKGLRVLPPSDSDYKV